MTTSELFKTIREKLGNISQAELARRVGEHPKSISNWENGRDIGANKLFSILKMLKFEFLLHKN